MISDLTGGNASGCPFPLCIAGRIGHRGKFTFDSITSNHLTILADRNKVQSLHGSEPASFHDVVSTRACTLLSNVVML